MQYTRTITVEIKVDDVVECLTADGWESGRVIYPKEDSLIVFMDYTQEVKEFKIEDIR
jgi:hypothetical protein